MLSTYFITLVIENVTNLMKVQHESAKIFRELWEEEGSKAQGPLTMKRLIILYPKIFITPQSLTWPPKSRAAVSPTQLCRVYMLGLGLGLA